ncbi:MAG: hypothetical protein LKI21_07550 [Bifidobacterium crudilactis]|nr:hypothetical protein [Bifidobacterium crudilactis]
MSVDGMGDPWTVGPLLAAGAMLERPVPDARVADVETLVDQDAADIGEGGIWDDGEPGGAAASGSDPWSLRPMLAPETGTVTVGQMSDGAAVEESVSAVAVEARDPLVRAADLAAVADDDPSLSLTAIAWPRWWPRRLLPVLAACVVCVLVASGGVVWYRSHVSGVRARGFAAAVSSCEESVRAVQEGVGAFDAAVNKARDASSIGAGEVLDATLVAALDEAVSATHDDADTCTSVSRLEDVERAAGRNARLVDVLHDDADRVARLAAEVSQSRDGRLLADAKSVLEQGIADAGTVLSESEDAVADEHTRSELGEMVKQAQALVDDGVDPQALRQMASTLSSLADAVRNSVEERRASDAAANLTPRSAPSTGSGSGRSSGSTPSKPSTPRTVSPAPSPSASSAKPAPSPSASRSGDVGVSVG